MEARKLISCARRLHILQAIYLTFNPGDDSVAGLRRLFGLTRSNSSVRIEQSSLLSLNGVIQSGRWERVNHKVMVYGLMHAEDDFLTPIARDLQSVATGDHGASGLFTSNAKRQQETAQQIIESVLNESIVQEVKSWGAKIVGRFTMYDNLPAVEFFISDAATGEKLVNVAVDGWSGRMAVDEVWGDRRYSDPQELRERIYSALTDSLDLVTAVAA